MAGTEVGRIYYSLDLDDDKFRRGAASAGGHADSLGHKLESVGKKAAIAFAAIGVAAVAFGVSAVKAFQESENAIAQTDAVLKSTGGAAGVTAQEVTKLATALQATTTYSDEAVRSATNMLLTFTSIGKDIMPDATRTVLDMSTALGQDTKSSAIQLGKALQDPINGITALRRVGVNFTDAQKEVITNLVNTGQKAEAQRLILKELGTEFGGSAAAQAGTFQGKLKMLQNQFGEVQEAIGKVIVNGLQPIVSALAGFIDKINEAGGPLQYFKKLFNDNQIAVSAIAGAILGLLVPAIIAMGISLWGALAPILPFLAAGALIGVLLNQLAQSMGGWGVLIDVVKEKISLLWGVLQTALGPSLQALWNTISTQVLPALKRLWDTLDPGLLNVLKIIAAVAVAQFVAVLWVLINVINVTVNIVTFLWNVISTLIQWFINAYNWAFNLAQGIASAFSRIKNAVSDAINGVKSTVSNAMSSVSSTINGWFHTFYDSGKRLIQSLGRGIADGVQYAVDAAKGVLKKVRNLLPFSDAKEGPLSDLTLSGKRFSQTFAKGITRGAGSIQDAAANALNVNGFGNAGFTVAGGAGGAAAGNGTQVNNTIGNIHIASDVDGMDWLGKLTRQDQLINDLGLSG